MNDPIRSLCAASLDVEATANALVPVLAERATRHDREGSFVHDNALLREHRLFAALVPTELGGVGASYAELADLIRRLAHGCASTALALSMHSHLVAAAVWKFRHGKPGEALLRKVVDTDAVLVSTGAGDWLQSNGELRRVDGGYRLTARKPFCSGSPTGTIFVTSAVHRDPERGPRVLHFGVPAGAQGVRVLDDWDTMGMRATGSNTTVFEDVFVPEEAVGLDRPQQGWHPAWNVVLTVAAPLDTAPYLGIAEAASQLACEIARSSPGPHTACLLGEMANTLTMSQLAHREMVSNVRGYDFVPENERADTALRCKTIAVEAAVATVDKAMEVIGGRSIARSGAIERFYRDVRAAPFHPLACKPQTEFTGRLSLGWEPVAGG